MVNYLQNSNAAYIDLLFEQYKQDPESIEPSWRYFFDGLELGRSEAVASAQTAPSSLTPVTPVIQIASGSQSEKEFRVVDLIFAYRKMGAFLADLNPLDAPKKSHPYLELNRFGLTSEDLSKKFSAGHLLGLGSSSLEQILNHLKTIYCGTVSVEYAHIQNPEARDWVQKQIEASGSIDLQTETKKFILKRLTESETFERFLHTRYVAQKRFSVEGGETVIPVLDCIIETAADEGVEEIVMGMAHRGRLNVLTHIFGKKPDLIFTEFEGNYKVDSSAGEGDVKYHKGYSSDFMTRRSKPIHLSLASNPSHLEFINCVVEGIARAKQDLKNDLDRKKVLPILIHGDAALAGQGVCYETLGLSQLEGYKTGGTLHIVINNQVGFTANTDETRATTYCTDVAKMLDAPVFHVNGDDPEGAWLAAKLCTEYRQRFRQDAFIDLICYRKHGHNEGDEPGFTQPLMVKKIKNHSSPREVYAKKLIQKTLITESEASHLVDEINQKLTEAQAKTKKENPTPKTSVFEGVWKGFKKVDSPEELFKSVKTQVDKETLLSLSKKLNTQPQGFQLHQKLGRFFEARLKTIQDGKGIDWGNAETLAFATLLIEGHRIRLSGQDVGRGTFSHRHSLLTDFETGKRHIPLNDLDAKQAPFEVINSFLSETGVLGFEHGYSLAAPNTLVIWEAQFGDFANGAQVIIDQFISATESKWQRMTGMVLLLPHGYEGQGPEHSSARLERFLSLCGKTNMVVVNLSTPAQVFHALRRQMKWKFRKPLIVMSPKSLLRHPQAVSNLEEFVETGFQEIIDDETTKKSIKRVILCSGKVYYDLLAERAARKLTDVAIVRLEQLYPWPTKKLQEILNERYAQAKDILWAQEEPRNMGAWTYVFGQWAGGLGDFNKEIGERMIRYVGREIGAAPAVGSPKVHESEQKALINACFND